MPTINISGQPPGGAAAQAAEKAYDPWEASLAEQRVARVKEGEYAAQKQADAQHKAALLLQQRVDRDHAAALRKQQAEQRAMDREQARIETTATARFEKRINQRYRAEQVAARKVVQDREREETRAENALQQRRQSRVRGFERTALIGAAAMAGVHGSFEGATTAVGGIAGAGIGAAVGALGGPFGIAAGAEFGLVLGEAIGKLVKGLVTLPQAPGNIWNAYLGAAKPYTDLQASQYSMARAGRFNGPAALSTLMPGTYTKNIPQWMLNLGVTPEAALESVNRTGITPLTGNRQQDMARTLAEYRNTSAYSNLAAGRTEDVAGQGMHLGLAAPGNFGSYLGAFAGSLEGASSRGMDKSRVLTNIQDAVEMMSRSGAGGVSSAALNDVMLRFMMGGTPGGRSGATAMASITGTTDLIRNMAQSTPGMAAFYQIAHQPQFEGLKTEGGIRKFVGERNWAAIDPARRSYIVSNVIKDMGSGNVIGAQQDLASVMQADTGAQWQSLTRGLAEQQFGAGSYLSRRYGAAYSGRDYQTQFDEGYANTLGALPGSGIDADSARIRTLSGSASDADIATTLRQFGVPEAQIPMIMSAAKARGVSPMELAAVIKHESGFNHNARNVNKNGTFDIGMAQINSSHAKDANLPGGWGKVMTDDYSNILEGATVLSGSRGLSGYNPGDPNYARDRRAELEQFYNVPTQANQATAKAAQATDTGAQEMFTNLNRAVELAGSTAETAAAAVHKFADSLTSVSNASKHSASHAVSSFIDRAMGFTPLGAGVNNLFGTDRTQGSAAHQ